MPTLCIRANEMRIMIHNDVWIALQRDEYGRDNRIVFSKEEWPKIKDIIDKALGKQNKPHIFVPYKSKND